MTSRYANISSGKQLEFDILTKAYESDTNQEKVNLSIQTYYSDSGKPVVLPIVRHVELKLALKMCEYDGHIPILGSTLFTSLVTKLILGAQNAAIRENRVMSCNNLSPQTLIPIQQQCFSVQTASLVGALRIGAEFLSKILKYDTIYVPKPTGRSHKAPFSTLKYKVKEYRYWNYKTFDLNFDGMKEDISSLPENSIVLLQCDGHMPTGCSLNAAQWYETMEIVKDRKLFPFFVMSFQGMISGDLDTDAFPIRLFTSNGIELFSAQSYESKFGLYYERTGNLTIVVNNPACIKPLQNHFHYIIRVLYSNLSYHGVKIMVQIMETPSLYQEWKNNLKEIALRLVNNRKALKDALDRLNTPGDWSHITSQKGVYSFTGLSRKQIIYLIKNKHIYLSRSGSINISGITKSNIEYIARAIRETVTLIK